MNLLFREDIKNKDHFDVLLVINSVTEKRFVAFIDAINNKQDWLAELCCCYYCIYDEHECYLFETVEGNEFYMLYEDFVEYIALAVVRYTNNSTNDDIAAHIITTIQGTKIAEVIHNTPINDEKKVALVFGQRTEKQTITTEK